MEGGDDASDVRFGRITLNGEGEAGTFKIGKLGLGWANKEKQLAIKAADIKYAKWVHIAKFYQLAIRQKNGAGSVQFDGFRAPDYDALAKFIINSWNIKIEKEELATKGWHWGEVTVAKGALQFMVGDKKAFDVPIKSIAQATQNKDDVQLIFPAHEDNTGVTPSLVELRLLFPENGHLRGEKREGQDKPDPITDAKYFQEVVLQETAVSGTNETKLTEISGLRLALPRGRFTLELYPRHAKLVGANLYRIPYENIARMYHLPHPKGDSAVSFILSMEPPIRRGQTVYPHIIMELATDEHINLELALTDEQTAQYKDELSTQMKGKPSSLIARLFKVLAGKKVTIPGGSFKSSISGGPMVACSVGALTGHLYLLERSMFFIDKPAVNIFYDVIDSVEFLRHSQITSNRNFDLEIKLKTGKSVSIGGKPKGNITFSHIAREDRPAFINLFKQKDITVKGLREERENYDELLGEESDEDRRGEEDDDDAPKKRPREKQAAKPPAAGGGGGADEDEEDDSDFGSEKSSSSDDLEYASKASSDDDDDDGEGGGEKKQKTKKTEGGEGGGDDENNDDE